MAHFFAATLPAAPAPIINTLPVTGPSSECSRRHCAGIECSGLVFVRANTRYPKAQATEDHAMSDKPKDTVSRNGNRVQRAPRKTSRSTQFRETFFPQASAKDW